MKLRSHLPHSHRLALVLAVLAVVAQLWMAQLSTRHLGAMLWQQTLWGEVCSTNDRTADADPQALSQIANCPVCHAVAAGLVPGNTPAIALAAAGDTPYLAAATTSAPVRALRHASLRPPAQAPPRA